MATAVTMPRLGLTMVEGTVVEWRARPGDAVTKGAVMLIVESEKAQIEVEAFASGVLAAVYVEAGRTVPVGTLLGAIAAPGESFDAPAFATAFVPAREEVAAAPAGGPKGARRPVATTGGPKAAPAARALARRRGVDLAAVTGTGPGGRITVEDVERAAPPVVEVNGAGLSVTLEGSGPTLLLVNGYGMDATGWRPQVEGLRGDHAVITWDPRGVGSSWPVAASVSVSELAADAAALLRHLGRVPAVVVGASLGAAVALEVGIAHADVVRALVLIAPVVARDARLEAVLGAWGHAETPASEAQVRAMLPWLLGRETLAHAGRREAAAAAWRTMATRTATPGWGAYADALLGWLGSRVEAAARIRVPTVVVVGADDVLTPPAHAEAVARAIPGARLVVIEGAGHAVTAERSAEVNAQVRALARAVRPSDDAALSTR